MNLPEILSEEHIRSHCPHCDAQSDAFTDLLQETEHFRIVCDHHPLNEGHILIIPKQHLSCVGEYPSEVFHEFIELYEAVRSFVRTQYGSMSTFEHGNMSQTVFHSHVHVLPYAGEPSTIVPEGNEQLVALPSFVELQRLYEHYGRYLFFSINNHAWVVNPAIAAPRFFRDRFATALGVPKRGNWKEMHMDEQLMASGRRENEQVKKVWKNIGL